MNAEDLRAFVWDLRVWTRGSDRAPHKAFTLIAALEHLRAERTGMASWNVLRSHVKGLLDDYSTSATAAAHYPVWRLSSDDDTIWQVIADGPLRTTSSGDVFASDLDQHDARAGFTTAASEVLLETPELIDELIRVLLTRTVPPTVWAEIIEAIGGAHVADALVPITPPPGRSGVTPLAKTRDPNFRSLVLDAWDGACAMCHYDGVRVEDGIARPIGLDAAHVQWHAYGGPDRKDNGIALCATDHRLFDRGMLGLAADGAVLVSPRLSSHSTGRSTMVDRYAGSRIEAGRLDYDRILWHTANVFRAG